MRRREFIKLLGGAAATWSLSAAPGRGDQLRRISVLSSLAETDLEGKSWDATFRKRLDELGWVDGRNVHIDYRWGAGSVERLQLFAKELIRLNPEVVLTVATPATAAMQRETHTIPIVFAPVSDPIGSGFVVSLSNPSGNITGFINIEASLSAKWIELIREVFTSRLTRGDDVQSRHCALRGYYLNTFRSAASAIAVEPIEAPVHSGAEVQAFLTKFGSENRRRPCRHAGYLNDAFSPNDYRACGALPCACHLRIWFLCGGWRLDVLRN